MTFDGIVKLVLNHPIFGAITILLTVGGVIGGVCKVIRWMFGSASNPAKPATQELPAIDENRHQNEPLTLDGSRLLYPAYRKSIEGKLAKVVGTVYYADISKLTLTVESLAIGDKVKCQFGDDWKLFLKNLYDNQCLSIVGVVAFSEKNSFNLSNSELELRNCIASKAPAFSRAYHFGRHLSAAIIRVFSLPHFWFMWGVLVVIMWLALVALQELQPQPVKAPTQPNKPAPNRNLKPWNRR